MSRVTFYSPFLLVYIIYLHIFVMLFYQVQLCNETVKPTKYTSQSVYVYPTFLSITTIF
jgi:hypothetical protein